MWKNTAEFEVAATNGKRFTLFKYQRFLKASGEEGSQATPIGVPKFRTFDWHEVHVLADGTYEMVASGLHLRRLP
jgi:hypothetical protein